MTAARWPALMKRRTAAEYLDTSELAFEKEVAAGRLPQPITLGGRAHWSKSAIDAAVAHIAGDRAEAKPDYLREFEERYGTAA